MLGIFTQRRFLNLSPRQQQKKCAEILKEIYIKLGENNKNCGEVINHYNLIQSWLGQPLLENITPEEVSNRYHRHLRVAQQSLKEHRLLPHNLSFGLYSSPKRQVSIRNKDRETGAIPLPIDIYLDHIRSAHNVGSIIRTTEAMRLGILCFSKDTPSTTHKQVKDASMGTWEWIECHPNAELKNLRRPFIALETTDTACSLYDFVFPDSFTLILGNEEYGCSHESMALADYTVEIPLRGKKNSLNVANAFAIVAAEIQRQKALDQNSPR
jgi:tRNA G18 (ribose-2'-O)-methylase SpoU